MNFPRQKLCATLEVSRSAYYAWRKGETHQQKNTIQEIEQKIMDTFSYHRKRYGSRRISKQIQKTGEKVSRYKVGKTLSKYGLKAIQPCSFIPKTTDSRHSYPISPNLLLGRQNPARPNEVWVGDITYVPLTGGAWAYLSTWMDLFSRRIVGWQLEDHMQESLVVTSL